MTLPLPNLDDRTFADLVDEARTLIRTHQPEWTNHNPSDPGIALIELFAWLAEMLIYRADQVPDRHRLAFLKLLNDPKKWHPTPSIDDDIAATLREVRRRYRAVTVEDYEALAREASSAVARSLCMPGRDLSYADEAARDQPRPGYVSVIVLPVADTHPDAADDLRGAVHAYLEPRRLLTTQNVIAAPVWSPVSPQILVAPREDVIKTDAVLSVENALKTFLDPFDGGRDATGWPFGRDVYVSELYRVLEALPEVDYVPDITLSSTCDGKPRCAPATVLWNAQGDQIGLQLASYALPILELEADAVLVSGTFVAIRAVVTVKPEQITSMEAAGRAIKAKLREIFDPVTIREAGEWETTSNEVRKALKSVAGEDVKVALLGDPSHVATNAQNETVVTLTPGELVDLQVEVDT